METNSKGELNSLFLGIWRTAWLCAAFGVLSALSQLSQHLNQPIVIEKMFPTRVFESLDFSKQPLAQDS
jgi:hypothetical protein